MPTLPRASDRRVQTVCLLILTLIACGVALWLLRPVLVPFVLAIFFAECLAPVIDWQIRTLRFPRWLAVSVASVLGLSLLTGVGFLIGASVARMHQNLPAYQASLNTFTSRILSSRPAHWLGAGPNTAAAALPQDQTISFITLVLGETTNIVSHGATVLILLAFLLFGRRQASADNSGIIWRIEERVQRYILVTVGISTLTGVLVGSTLSILGVQFAALFGFLAFLLNFIPNLGGIITTLLPLPIIWLSPDLSISVKVLALAIPGGIQVLVGSFIQPKTLGSSLDLHPVVLLLALLFFTMIWGVPGAFLATPLTAVIKIVFEKIPATSALAAVLAGDLRPMVRSIDAPATVRASVDVPAELLPTDRSPVNVAVTVATGSA
jgi:AI-2 transport protein TqsA